MQKKNMDSKLSHEDNTFIKRLEIALRIGAQQWGPMNDFVKPTREALACAVIIRARQVKDNMTRSPKYWSVAQCVTYPKKSHGYGACGPCTRF